MHSKSHKQTVFSIFQQETRKHPWFFAMVILGILISETTELIAPLYMKQFFNGLALTAPSPTIIHGLVLTLIVIAVLYLIGWAAYRLQNFGLIFLESRVVANLYAVAFKYLIGHSYHFFSSQFSGTLTRRVSKFANAYESLMDSIMLQFVPTTLYVVGAVAILFSRNHALGVALGAWAACFILFQYYVSRLQRPLRKETSEEDSRLVGSLADAISNQNTIGLFSGGTYEQSRFDTAAHKWYKVTLKSWTSNEYIWMATGLLVVFIQICLLFGALHFWQLGLLTIGDFVLIQAYLLTTIQQLYGINRNLRRFYESYSDASEMVEILNTPHGIQDVSGAPVLRVSDGAINFNAVDFYFYKDRPVLENFNLSVHGNEKIALVGPSGAGKSTIIRLLLRFYDVKEGAILIDGQDIDKVTQDSLRDAIAFVPQEPILFHRSLMENIRYGRRDATDEEVLEAARKAHCHEFISGFPEGYETFVGERGVKLSGGERQRVAIARALLKNAPILVLDEATSSLDSESESLIQNALDVLMEGKTVITIAHRLSTIMKMDRIVVVDGGKVVSEGTHDELLKEGTGLYHKLWSIQAGGFISAENPLD